MTNRYIGTDAFFVLGGTLTSPFIFILDDIIAEIYGYKIARLVIFFGFLMLLLFCIFSIIIVNMQHPSHFTENEVYSNLLGLPLLQITLSGFVAYAGANLMNAYVLTRWKFLLKGKKFWLRSIGASFFSALFYSFVAIFLMQIGKIPLLSIFKIIMISTSIKILYSILFAFPANMLTNYIKIKTGIDVYDFSGNTIPINFFKSRQIDENG